jgi:hypothetical protein
MRDLILTRLKVIGLLCVSQSFETRTSAFFLFWNRMSTREIILGLFVAALYMMVSQHG